jgi:hypothetical protein
MRKVLVAAIVLVTSLAASPAYAWGSSAHRYIMRRAIELLPPAIKPFFETHRDELVMRIVDPDLWRNIGWEEDPNHFVDFGAKEYGEYPFKELPREYGAALEKFGLATLKKNGTLPWREAEEFGNLRRAFESAGRGSGFGGGDVILFSAVASHYIQDAHQPLHATDNYDGKATGQDGIHARFESALFDRYEDKLTINPPAMKSIANPRDAAFDALLDSYKLVERVLAADKDAARDKDEYDDDYFDKLFAKVKPILEQRIAASISATAALIAGAWEQAGRPEFKAAARRPPQKVKKSGVRNTLQPAPAPRGRRA